MPLFGLFYRDQLKGATLDEFENLTARISSWALKEHTEDGGHKDLTVDGNVTATGSGTFPQQPRVFVKLSATTLVNNTETVLSWDTPAADGTVNSAPDTGWNVGGIYSSAQPTLFIAPEDGNYLISYAVRFTGNATGYRYAFLTTTRFGAPADFAQNVQGGHASQNMVAETFMIPLKIGQGVFLHAFQNSGGNLALLTGFSNSWFQMTKMS